jgi:hypothetical protein
MKNLKNSQDTMTTVFKIIGGNRLSNEYKGKTKEQILAIEENIKSELKQKIEPTDKSVLNFIINLHDEAFQTEREKGKVPHILSSLLRRVNEKEGEVEIITSYPEDNIFVSDEGVKFYHPTEKVKGKPKEITKAQYTAMFKNAFIPTKKYTWLYRDDEGDKEYKSTFDTFLKFIRAKNVNPLSNLPKELQDRLEANKKRMAELEEQSKKPKSTKEKESGVTSIKDLKEQSKESNEKWEKENPEEAKAWARLMDKENPIPDEEAKKLSRKYKWGFDPSKMTVDQIKDWYKYKWPSRRLRKSLDILLDHIGEADNILIKEDVGLILESANSKDKKKLKTLLQHADPTEFFGHDFLKLGELIKVLKTFGVVKGDKKLNKKVLNYEDKNLKVVKLATKLRKDYELLYANLRKLIYPKQGEK